MVKIFHKIHIIHIIFQTLIISEAIIYADADSDLVNPKRRKRNIILLHAQIYSLPQYLIHCNATNY